MMERNEIYDVIGDGESPCPDCGAEWKKPTGKGSKKAENKVMIHTNKCGASNEPK